MIPFHKRTTCLLLLTIFLIYLFTSETAHAQGENIFTTPPSEPTEVQLGIFLLDIESPAPITFPSFEAQMFLDMKWRDERLAFDATENGTDHKIFLEHEARLQLERIWWPDIEIENGDGVRRTENLELIIFADGTVEYEERFVASIKTDFNLRQFPFDEQDLEIDIESFAWDESSVIFIALDEKIGSDVEEAGSEWIVTHFSTDIRPEPEVRSEFPFSEFIFTMHLKRLPGYYLWRVAPMIILIILSWTTFWMEGEPMPGRMGRSFIALLTVVAFHRIVSDMMPRISYTTFLDGMVLIAYLFTSITIVENVIVNRFRVRNDNETANRIDEISRWLVPLGFLLLSGLTGLLFLR